jgi:hypothetical protein
MPWPRTSPRIRSDTPFKLDAGHDINLPKMGPMGI